MQSYRICPVFGRFVIGSAAAVLALSAVADFFNGKAYLLSKS